MRAGAGAEAKADAETETETGAREEQRKEGEEGEEGEKTAAGRRSDQVRKILGAPGDLSGYLRVSETTRASATWRLQAGQTSGSRPSKSEWVIINKYMRDAMYFIMLDAVMHFVKYTACMRSPLRGCETPMAIIPLYGVVEGS